VSEKSVVQRGYRIRGRVQGVFFRAWTRQTALALGLGGTVENCADGSVEAHLIGTETDVEEMEALFWQGPSASRVEGVEILESRHALDPHTFRILH